MKVNSKQLKSIIQEEIRRLRNEGDYGDFRSDEEKEEEEIDMPALKKAAGLDDPDEPPADPEDPDDPEGEMEMPEDLGESADLYAVWGEIAGITELSSDPGSSGFGKYSKEHGPEDIEEIPKKVQDEYEKRKDKGEVVQIVNHPDTGEPVVADSDGTPI